MKKLLTRSLAACRRSAGGDSRGPLRLGLRRMRFEALEDRRLLDVGPLLISEFMADNDNTLDDEDGNSSDWIEIYNSSDSAKSLDSYYLTDTQTNLTRWQFPAVTIDPFEYLIVFASGKDRRDPAGELHTNFGLSNDGDSVALVMSDQATVAHAYWDFPRQLEDVSYGLPDVTTLWDTLISPGGPASYRVPTIGDNLQAWTQQSFDDSSWVDTVSLDPAGLVITEVATGETDWLEIQNVSNQAIDTTGWFVAVNDTTGGIGAAHAVVWNLPNSIDSGQVLYRTDNLADEAQYFGSEISWDTGSGWVAIIDNSGGVVDFVPWGYDALEIAPLRIDAGAFTDVALGDRWQGTGVPGGAGQVELINIEDRWWYEQSNTDLGSQWREPGYSDSLWDDGKALLYVENSGLPAAKNTPLTLGASTYYFRSHFTLDAHPDSVTQLDLETVIDDGAIIYINGKEVYRLGIDEGRQMTHGDYANRSVGDAAFEANTIPPENLIQDGVPVLVRGDNVIAVEVHQINAGSSDVVMGLGLHATVLEPELERIGNSDVDTAGDFALPTSPSQGTHNAGMTLPFAPGTIPALTGLGFSEDGALAEAVETDVEAAMRGVNASLWSRIEFPVGDPSQFDVLTLNVQYDDGFVAYLNGEQVTQRNAPDPPEPLEPLPYNAAATDFRDGAEELLVEEINISDYLDALRPAQTNVLAIHGLNYGVSDDDFLILPELIATSTLDGPQYMTSPTPSNDNQAGAVGAVGDTEFSVDRGFYDAAFDLEIVTGTVGAEIRYTLDGSRPTATYGSVYNDPIPITTTTVLRAAAFKAGYIPTNVDTQTYIFLQDVLNQPSDPLGFPATWGSTPSDYEMDVDVIGTFDADGNPTGGDLFGGAYASLIDDALLSLPTISIVTEVDYLFGSDGIYTNSGGQGVGWERPTSVEWIEPDGTTGFQVDAGLRIYGGAFRGMGLTQKKTFRLLFKDVYGPSKLNFPLFDADDAATKFDTIILRAGANDGWNRWGGAKTQYIVDEFMRRTQLALGQPASHGTFAHLYLNGLYWGLYNPVERPEASFAASYFGGEKENWEAVNSGEGTGGSGNALWNALLNFVRSNDMSTMEAYQRLQGNNPDGTPNPAYQDLLDVDNYIAYMFSNFWGGTGDWPGHNWYGAAPKPPNDTGYKFFNWDSEGAIVIWSNLNADVTGVNNGGGEPYAILKNDSEEFRLLFGDYAHQWLYNGGAATAAPSFERYQELADEIELAIVAESARWGDHRGGNADSTPYTQATWDGWRDYILDTYMPQRPEKVRELLHNAGLYPQLNAPVLNQHGGQIEPGFEVTMSFSGGGVGAIYEDTVVVPQSTAATYFVPTDNSLPAEDPLSTTWTEWGFNDSSATSPWLAGTTGIGYEDGSGYANRISTEVRPYQVNPNATSILVRIPFTIDDLSNIDKLTLRMQYDDGFVAYLNGKEVHRSSGVAGYPPNWDFADASSHEAGGFDEFDITDDIGLLVQGSENILAIHGLNRGATSSDMLILPELVIGELVSVPGAPVMYYTTDGSDPRLLGGAINLDSAQLYDEDNPFSLAASTVVKTRTYQGGEWSALNRAVYHTSIPPTLAITEINYNPHEPLPDEVAAGFENGDLFEFIELQNVGDATVSLDTVHFANGIDFNFTGSDVTSLAPGERVVVAKDQAAFEFRYGTSVNVAGYFDNDSNLGNAGERIQLAHGEDTTFIDFRFNDAGRWPGRADGKGA
ncbi:MAG: lamin tail domain-containing protein, partial [Candidatus Nealsonbacteria bacterium]|nr:lamin tail domain-containing protein [Candidatus Nealsonbacteria bacterium]